MTLGSGRLRRMASANALMAGSPSTRRMISLPSQMRQVVADTPDGILDLRSKGRAVVYELHDSKGSDLDATYELACALAEIGKFDKLTLDYDTFAPDGSLNVQIIIELPNYVGETATYDGVVETKYNNALQASDSLVEITPPSTGAQ